MERRALFFHPENDFHAVQPCNTPDYFSLPSFPLSAFNL